MGCKNSCRILFPIYNCRGKGSFFAPDKSYDFFYHQARKIFFFKKLTMFVSFPEAIQKRIVKVRHGKTCRSKGEENEAYRQNGIL